jgi:hypothetical protein
MAKLFIFGIGGTGSRVLKALAMLFSAGCRLPNGFDTVVPVIIDPDVANGDLDRTKDILRLYQEIRMKIHHPDDFFAQKVLSLPNISEPDNIDPGFFQFQLTGTHQNKFEDYLDYNNLPAGDKLFLKLLYSEKNLRDNLDVGFKGNPHMGSMVLNQFTTSKDFQDFGSAFNPGDAVFIINSIFGGTGAAGFPLLIKNLRSLNTGIANIATIVKSPVGGITYLPYFNVNHDETSAIDSDTFLEKSKIAIDYYNRTIIGQPNTVNALYFLGNIDSDFYPNNEGKGAQRNKAHFLELAGALSIFDFCQNIRKYQPDDSGSFPVAEIKEYGIENDTAVIKISDLNNNDKSLIRKPLTKYKLFSNYLSAGLPRALGVSAWTIKSRLDSRFFHSDFYEKVIVPYNRHFEQWLAEMASNKPSFAPFKSTDTVNALEFVDEQGKQPKGYWYLVNGKSFKSLDIENCRRIGKVDSENEVTHFIKLFGKSTQNVLENQKLI